MSTIQLAPSTLAYKFESPGKYGLANYVDSNHDYNLLEFNAYKDQPYHLYPEFKYIQLRKLKNPKRRIMISHVRERLNYDSKILRAHAVFIDWLIQSEVCTAQQILYVIGCQDEFDFLDSYKQACLSENVFRHRITVISYPHFETDAVWRFTQGEIQLANKNFDELQNFVKNDFLFLNAKIHKINRLNLAIRLNNHNMLKHGVWSLNTSHTVRDLYPKVSHLISKYDFDWFYSKIPHSPDNIKYDSEADHYLGYPFDHTLYENTKYSIVSETHVDNNDAFMITEKTARAIINKHPFIMASTPRYLDQLRSRGYQTFSDLWPEDYDQEFDDEKRMQMIADTVKYIYNNPIDWVRAYSKSKHNYTRLQRRYDDAVKKLTQTF
tara:strand:+ start:273 stop:1412 length:1140 start_codon:yes stop_codon:yes gene_type:complete